MSREDVMVALFNALAASGAYATTGRRLIHWGQVAEQPALFLRHVGDETPPRPTNRPGRVVMECEAWVYAKRDGDPAATAETPINGLIDAIDLALRPPPGRQEQTLGGMVQHAWIEGRTEIHPGDLDGQAIAVIPLKVLVPVIG